jgi:hypothetical protein
MFLFDVILSENEIFTVILNTGRGVFCVFGFVGSASGSIIHSESIL